MAFNNGALAYDEDERSAASGNGQNIFDKMEFFMEAGCLCVPISTRGTRRSLTRW